MAIIRALNLTYTPAATPLQANPKDPVQRSPIGQSLRFALDEKSGEIVIRVPERETGVLIRCVPMAEVEYFLYDNQYVTGQLVSKRL